MSERYEVEIRNGWSYVTGPTEPEWGGPWRYQWEAQEEADRLNAAAVEQTVPDLVECDQCGGSGFDTPGTGYGNVCGKCGGLKEFPRR
jgi:hypothetical protein